VYWDNVESDCALQLEAVRLQTLDGGDANRNGVKDWVENRLLAQHGIEVAPATSAVSPACIEGRGQHPALMDCRAGVAGNGMVAVPIQPGPGNRWYANVPLLPDSPTQVHIHYQNGAMSESRAIRWRPTNLLEARDLTLRKGDALLLTAVSPEFPEGQVTITVGGVTNYTTDAITPVVHRFNHPGVFTVTGSFVVSGRFSAASRSRSITVKVVEAAFDGPVAAWVAKGRFWDCSSLPPEAVLEYDPRLKVVPISPTEHRLQLPDPPPAWNGRQYRLTNDAAEARYIVARLGDNGPILASTVVQGFRLFNCYDTYLKYVQIFEDGSQLIEEAFVLSPVLPDLTVVVRIIVSGVTFDDGTLVKTLTARDFDDLGVCRVRYVRAAGIKSSVCHTTKAYQDGMLVGWPAYEK
jgi:hypothetical protein